MIAKRIKFILLFVGILFGWTLFPLIPIAIFNIDLNKMTDLMYVLYTFCCDIGFMIILFIIYKKTIIDDFKKYLDNFKNDFNFSFKYYLVGLALMVISNLIISNLFSGAVANNDIEVRKMIDLFPLYMIFSVSIKAPFIEEIIFRKSIYDSVTSFGENKLHIFLYIMVSGLIFSSLHVLGMTKTYLDYLYIIPYMSLGCMFAYIYVRTGNIFSTITMHSLHNTVTIILFFLQGVIL